MNDGLPALNYPDLVTTRDYLQDVSRIIGKLQQVFLPTDPHDWQRGIVVHEQGLASQPFTADDQEYQALLNLQGGTMELGGAEWQLGHYSAPELLNNLQVWLGSRGVQKSIEQPEFGSKTANFEPAPAADLAKVLTWLEQQFQTIGAGLSGGLVSPVLLYPHHFDLSLVWFPHADEQQFGLGFSTGDDTITEPYLYITAYPEPKGFTALDLPHPAYWQQTGFSGAIVRYADLASSQDPERLIRRLWAATVGPTI